MTVSGGRVATVSWSPVSSRFAPERYTVSVDPAHSDPITVKASQTTAVFSGLQPGVAYSFKVTAGNQIGSGPSSVPTPAATVIIEHPYPGQPLREGSQGGDVQLWQEALGVTADGDFGPATTTATREWQRANGLTPDGIVGEASWNKMFSPPEPPEPTPDPQPDPDPDPEPDPDPTESEVPSYPGFVLRVGSRGKWVRTWQSALGVAADGYFGDDTARATREWQRVNGLDADGVVGMQSWRAMFPGAGVEEPTPPPPIAGGNGDGAENTNTGPTPGVPPYPGRPLEIGDGGSNVIIWQRALGIEADGYFGSATLSATNAWQYRQGLTADGVVGAISWLRMFPGAVAEELPPEDSVDSGGGFTGEVPPYPGRPLQTGSRGTHVIIWQRALGVGADGHFGSQTAQATREWQRANRLEVDGIVGINSWLKMFPGASVPGGSSSPGSTSTSRPASVVLKEGDSGATVEKWQRALDIEVTGVFDANTVTHTKAWQRTQGIAADGRVTETSWYRMFPDEEAPDDDASSSGSDDSSTSPDESPPERPSLEVLEQGDTGPRVEKWQRALGIPVTGVFDANTVTHTKAWQRTQGIAADGRVTETSWYRMFPDEE